MKTFKKIVSFLVAGLGCLAMANLAFATPQPFISGGQVLEVGGGVSPSSDVQWDDGVNVCMGTDSDYCWTYSPTDFALYSDSIAGNVLMIEDGTDDVNFSGGINLAESINFTSNLKGISRDGTPILYVNDANGKALRITPNNVIVTEIAMGGQLFYDNKIIGLGGNGTVSGADYWQVYNSTGTAFELWSTNVDGGGSDGKVLWIEDGTDDVNFSGGISIAEELDVGVTVIDCADDPYTVPAGVHYLVANSDTGSCTGNLDVTLPAADCAGDGNACRRINIMNTGAVQVDVAGTTCEGTTKCINGVASQAVTQWGSITVLDVNISSTTDWIIE